jgi:hypothetical protein
MARVRNACRDLAGKPKGKRPVERHGSSWEDSIKMDLRDTGWGGMNIIDLTEDRDQWRAIANKKTPWSQSASELYRPSVRRLSAK